LTARSLLVRGMLVGILAGLIAFAFARVIGEPQVERAIAFETSMDKARGEAPEPQTSESQMVSRKVQRGLGLLTGVIVYGASIGGIFGLVFALSSGRVGINSPRTLSAMLALLGFLTIVLVPQLKYPANPPAVGNPDTIGTRTAAYFLMIAFSIAAAVLSLQISRGLRERFGAWNGNLLAAAIFIVIVASVSHFFPAIDEVPAGFPASLLWRFRVASIAIQATLWTTVGLLFGALTERANSARS
jgi:predicted cobalt transporter CbtA